MCLKKGKGRRCRNAEIESAPPEADGRHMVAAGETGGEEGCRGNESAEGGRQKLSITVMVLDDTDLQNHCDL